VGGVFIDKIIIRGGINLKGDVTLNGFKHALVPILASSILTDKTVIIQNVPRIKDTFVLTEILNNIGVYCELKGHTMKIRSRNPIPNDFLVSDLFSSIHGSLYLLPALLARVGRVKISYPGGCKIGVRPIKNVAFVLRRFGAKVKFKNKIIDAYLAKTPETTKIILNFKYNKYYSSATKSAIIMGALTKRTIIKNAYRAPEIIDLAQFLKATGVNIEGAGTKEIQIEGAEDMKGCKYSIMPDLIELGTFIGAVGIAHGTITINNIPEQPLNLFGNHLSYFSKMGVDFYRKNKKLKIVCDNRLKSVKIVARPYPGIYSDLQPIFCAMMSTSVGCGEIKETVWENRFKYVKELKKMGAKIRVIGNKLVVKGVERLKGCILEATDLRGAAAMVLAGLNADGETVVNNAFHIERGYEDFDKKLKNIGAEITRRQD